MELNHDELCHNLPKEESVPALLKETEEVQSKKAKIDKGQAEMDEALAELYSCAIVRLFVDGLKGVKIIGSTGATNTSSHDASSHAAVNIREEQHFQVSDSIHLVNLLKPSLFLLCLDREFGVKTIHSSHVKEIAYYLRALVRDVMKLVGIDEEVRLQYQDTVFFMTDGNGQRSMSDIWYVTTKSNVPIAVVEVKQPRPSKLSNLKVLGRAFDYMSHLRNSFGQCEVFGIVTTLEKWRVVWFPDSDAFATSSSLIPPEFEGLMAQFPPDNTLDRSLYCSRKYSLDDPMLLKVMGTIFLKSMNAHYRAISLLSSHRAYTILKRDKWEWGKISEEFMQSHPHIYLTLPEVEPSHLVVLRHFYGGSDGQVCLALTEDFNLVAVKKFYDVDKCEREYNMWKSVYGVDVLLTKFVGSDCLIMPFVFPCEDKFFDFDLSHWVRYPECSLLGGDYRLDEWTTKFMDYALAEPEKCSVTGALIQAVDNLAEKNMVHNDIEWRHVALLPVVDSSCGNGVKVVGMKPLLIDLSSVFPAKTSASAREQMEKDMNELLDTLPS